MATKVSGGGERKALEFQVPRGLLWPCMAFCGLFCAVTLSVPAWSQETAGTKPPVAAAVKKVSSAKKKAALSGKRRPAKRSTKARRHGRMARGRAAAGVPNYKNSPYKFYGLMKGDVFIYSANGKPVRPEIPRTAKKRGKSARRHFKSKVTAKNKKAAAKFLAAVPMSAPKKRVANVKKARRSARHGRRDRRQAAAASAKPYVIPTLDKSRLPPPSMSRPSSGVSAQSRSGAAAAQQTAAAKASAARIVNQVLKKNHVPPSALNQSEAQAPAAPPQPPAGGSPSVPPTVPVTPP